MVRTRFAPSPTGRMHIGNLRTALYEYLIARVNNGKFVLRIEDTDQNRLVEGAVDIIYNTLKIAGITHDEGPDVGGDYGPYVQSERVGGYLDYAKQLVAEGKAYYCFCTKERLESLHNEDGVGAQYDRHCLHLSQEEITKNLEDGVPYVIRQLIPEGKTTYTDVVYGEISFDNSELDDQVLIKSDGYPTYNFANVIDDHLMAITHVVRGSEYLSSTPKYNLLYESFGWEIPTYIHLPLILNQNGEKLSKRKGDASFEDMMEMGYLPEAIINYVALLGWSPSDNQEIFTLAELEQVFDVKGLSKSPSMFDMTKLTWVNGEHIRLMSAEAFFEYVKPYLAKAVTKRTDIAPKVLAAMVQSRVNLPSDVIDMLDFIDEMPEYSIDLYTHKKMKTNPEIALDSLKAMQPVLAELNEWDNDHLYESMTAVAAERGVKNGQILWPIRTALSGKPATPCGASELAELLGKEESLKRIETAIKKLMI